MSVKDYGIDAVLGALGGLSRYDPARTRPGIAGFLPMILSGAANAAMMRRQQEQELEQKKQEDDRIAANRMRLERITHPLVPPPDVNAFKQSLYGVASGRLSPEQRQQIIPGQFQPSAGAMKGLGEVQGEQIQEQFETPLQKKQRGLEELYKNAQIKNLLSQAEHRGEEDSPNLTSGVSPAKMNAFVSSEIANGRYEMTDDDWLVRPIDLIDPSKGVNKTPNFQKMFAEILSTPEGKQAFAKFARIQIPTPYQPTPAQMNTFMGRLPIR